jgi:hypothetical protein
MEAIIVIGSVLILCVAIGIWIVFSGRKETIAEGRGTVSRGEVSRAEKEQMTEPQEEFIGQDPPSSK